MEEEALVAGAGKLAPPFLVHFLISIFSK